MSPSKQPDIKMVNLFHAQQATAGNLVSLGLFKGKVEAADHVWNSVRDEIRMAAVWAYHFPFLDVHLWEALREKRVHPPHRCGRVRTCLEQDVVQLLQKLIVDHLWLFRGQTRIA
jgi:hypothetical protein